MKKGDGELIRLSFQGSAMSGARKNLELYEYTLEVG